METLFWSFWLATVGVCAWQIWKGLSSPGRMVHWPFLATCMWLYFYVYMAYQAKSRFGYFVPDWAFVLGQVVPLACLLSVIAGWNIGVSRLRGTKTSQPPRYNPDFVWVLGMLAVLIGTVGTYSVYGTITREDGQIDLSDASAYWYLLYFVAYPGFAVCLWASYHKPAVKRMTFLILTVAGAVIFILPSVIHARRGPIFPLAITMLWMPPIAKKVTPSRIAIIGGIAGVALLMLIFVRARDWIYNTGTWSEALSGMTVENVVVSRGEAVTDNEYVNNCHEIGTLAQTGRYQYGTGHLELLVHWIPHQIWKNKPGLGGGIHSKEEIFDDVERMMHIRLLGDGASAGGVAETFEEYGFLCPVFWFVLSFCAGKIYCFALKRNDPRWQVAYVCLLCASHWLIAQGFDAAFVPAMFFQAVPFLIFAVVPKAYVGQAPVRVARKAVPTLSRPLG